MVALSEVRKKAIWVDLLLAKKKANDKADGLRRSPPWSRKAAISELPLEQ